MNDITVLMNSLLFEHVSKGIGIVAVIVAAILIAAVFITVHELKKQKGEMNAAESACDNGEMSAADNTD